MCKKSFTVYTEDNKELYTCRKCKEHREETKLKNIFEGATINTLEVYGESIGDITFTSKDGKKYLLEMECEEYDGGGWLEVHEILEEKEDEPRTSKQSDE